MISQNLHFSHTWSLVPSFLIRSTGFPFEYLRSLRMPVSMQDCMLTLACQQQVERKREEFRTYTFPQILDREQQRGASATTFEHWYQLNRCIRKGSICPPALQTYLADVMPEMDRWVEEWNTLLRDALSLQEQFEQSFSRELKALRFRLYEIAQDQRFQEALLLSNPNMYSVGLPSYLRHYSPEERSSKMRHLERRLYTYLQRFCAKNDTTSFFGPIDYGWYRSDKVDVLSLTRLSEGELTQRLTRMTYWAAQALADVIAKDPAIQPYLVPKLQYGCRILPSGELSVTIRQQRVALSAELVALLRAIDGQRCLRDVCELFSSDKASQIKALSDKGLVLLRIEIPTATFDPLAWLHEYVAHLPVECSSRMRWLECLEEFHQSIAAFSATPTDEKLSVLQSLEEKFSALTGLPARRGEGETYVDRFILYDEAQGDISSCTLGRPFHDRLLESLQPVLDLCGSYGVLLQRACMRQAQNVFMAMGKGEPLPYLAFVHQLDKQVRLEDCMADPEVAQFLAGLTDLAREQQQSECIRLSPDDLAAFLQPLPRGTMISPDLFLAAPDVASIQAGNYKLVIGEIHYGTQVWCHFLTFCEQFGLLAQTLEQRLLAQEQDTTMAAVVHRRQQGKTFYLELPGSSIEMMGRSTKARDQVLQVADLEVFWDDDRLQLRSSSQGCRLRLYPGDPRSVSNWLFGTPPVIPPEIRLAIYTPRIEISGVVFQRARWRLSTAEFALPQASMKGSALMLHANACRLRFGLPEQCFVRVPSERKPFYVDFANLISLELFFHMISKDPLVELSECLPEIEDWWLKKSQGTHSCEWRMTLICQ